jgi:hypothetical protein
MGDNWGLQGNLLSKDRASGGMFAGEYTTSEGWV